MPRPEAVLKRHPPGALERLSHEEEAGQYLMWLPARLLHRAPSHAFLNGGHVKAEKRARIEAAVAASGSSPSWMAQVTWSTSRRGAARLASSFGPATIHGPSCFLPVSRTNSRSTDTNLVRATIGSDDSVGW